MSRYQEIILRSTDVNKKWKNYSVTEIAQIVFPVPANHFRYKEFQTYPLTLTQLSVFHFLDDDLVILDEEISSKVKRVNDKCRYVALKPIEGETKVLSTITDLLSQLKEGKSRRVVAIGGGIILNVATYIAEQLKTDLILVPTTVIAMSDSAIGGKVRMNDIRDGKFIKHKYKSFYEPSAIILDPQFLEFLDEKQIRVGLAEVIKHALYQSPELADYLLSDSFQPITDKNSLLKAILWTADLKRICLEVDPEESADGSYLILRAAHDISDKLEEESKFTLPHAQAVIDAMKTDLQGNPLLFTLREINCKLGLS